MNVIHYTAKYLPISQTFIRDLIQHLSLSDNEHIVLTHNLISKSKHEYFPVIDISFNHYPSFFRRAFNYYHKYFGRAANINYSYASKIIKSKNVDLVHCHFGTAAYYYFHLQKNKNLKFPLLISFHGYDVFNLNKLEPDYKFAINSLLASGSLITCPSVFLKNKIIDVFRVDESMVRVIPNGFNEKLFTIESYKKRAHKTLKVGHCGRFVNWKGQEILLRALNLLVSKGYDNIHATFIGDGDLFDDLKGLSEQLELDSKVTFSGALPHKDVAKLLKEQDLYVHPSFTLPNGQAETFGIAILEAVALGKPVVITNSGGMKEIFPDQNSQFVRVVEEKSVEDLAKGIEYFINNMDKFSEIDFEIFQNEVLQLNNLNNTADLIKECYKELVKL